jgi:uroporphyrinogen-III synthase
MRVLITRPVEDAERTAEVLKARGHEAILAPLFSLKQRAHGPMRPTDAFLATSANALRALVFAGVDLSKPIFTVGNATAQEAMQQGFSDVRSADGDGDDLTRLVRSQLKMGASLCYLTGQPRNDAAVQALAAIYAVDTIETYETVAEDVLPASARYGLLAGNLDAVLHFSPRAAAVFTKLVEKAGLFQQTDAILHVFISRAAQQVHFNRRRVADKPTLQAMFDCLEKA